MSHDAGPYDYIRKYGRYFPGLSFSLVIIIIIVLEYVTNYGHTF